MSINKLRAPFKYQVFELLKAIGVYYAIITLAYLLISIAMSFVFSDGIGDGGTFSGMDGSSFVVVFILGLTTFKENLGLFVQNGVSRRSFYITKLASAIIMCLVVIIADRLLLTFLGAIGRLTSSFKTLSVFEQMTIEGASTVSTMFMAFFSYLLAFASGTFLTIMFYRLNGFFKVIVGAGVPILCFIVFPIADTMLFQNKVSMALVRFADFALGLSKGLPWNAVITLLLCSALTFCLAWLILRRAVVRK